MTSSSPGLSPVIERLRLKLLLPAGRADFCNRGIRVSSSAVFASVAIQAPEDECWDNFGHGATKVGCHSISATFDPLTVMVPPRNPVPVGFSYDVCRGKKNPA